MIFYRGQTITLFAHFVNRDGSEATITAGPTVEICHFNGTSLIQDLPATPMVLIAGSRYRFDYTISTTADYKTYQVTYRATYDDGTNVEASEEFQVEKFPAEIEAILEDTGTSLPAEHSSLSTNLDLLVKIEKGRWKIENNRMVFYDTDNITPLLAFDLKDALGNPTEINPAERIPVERGRTGSFTNGGTQISSTFTMARVFLLTKGLRSNLLCTKGLGNAIGLLDIEIIKRNSFLTRLISLESRIKQTHA